MSTIRVSADERPAALAELVVEEAEIEAGIVRDQRAIADELEQLLAHVAEGAACRQEAVGQAVHRLGLARHRPAGIEIGVEGAPGLDPVDQLDAADLDHPVAVLRAEAGGLGVEDDFAHGLDYESRAPRRGKR